MNHLWVMAAFGQEGTELSSEQGQFTTEETTEASGGQTEGETQEAPSGFNPLQIVMFAGLFFVMYMLLFRGPKKKQKEHKKMVASIQKNARVRTIGGILGTVINVKDDEITVKIDESNNTKITVIPSAIAAVLSDEVK